MEEDHVFSGDNVRDTVAIVGHGTETAAGRDAIRIFGGIESVRLTVRRLRGGQAPRLAQHLLQEGRVDFQVLGDDVQAEQVTIDAFAAHGVLVAALVLSARQAEQPDPFRVLINEKRDIEKKTAG